MIEVHAAADTADFYLKSAILLYGGAHSGEPYAYASIHDIGNGKKGPEILPGVPMSVDGLAAALRILEPKSVTKPTLLPSSVLSQGPKHLVWWRPPQTRQIWVKAKELGGARTNKVPNPGYVFITTQNDWWVFAIKGKERPDAETPLFQAPYFNVWEGGRICTGSVDLPKDEAAASPEAWEKAFFRSYFTHPNIHTPKGLTLYKNGPYALWRDLLDCKLSKFPERSLVPAKMTLGQAFDHAMSSLEA